MHTRARGATLPLGSCSAFLLICARRLPFSLSRRPFIILHSNAFGTILANCVEVSEGAVSLISLFIPLSTLDSKLACNDKRRACLTPTRTFLKTFTRVYLQIFFWHWVRLQIGTSDENAGGSVWRSHDRASSSEQALAATQ